jgi:hypothetical protein
VIFRELDNRIHPKSHIGELCLLLPAKYPSAPTATVIPRATQFRLISVDRKTSQGSP